MIQTTYIFLAYGASSEVHKQTIASICTLAAVKHVEAGFRTVLYTDTPEYYQWLNLDVLRVLADGQIEEWMGPARFGFRIKPCLMAEVAKDCSGPLIFLDGDTVVTGDLSSFESILHEGGALMHLKEYQVSDRQTKERREYMDRIGGLDLGDGIMLTESSWMWNSGLIGLPSTQLDAPKKVIPMIDRMITAGLSTRTRLKEQLAFSLNLSQHCELHAVGDAVLHYWGNKPQWDGFLDRWLLFVLGRGMSAAEAGQLLLSRQPFPVAVAPKKSKAEKRKAKLRKWLRLN